MAKQAGLKSLDELSDLSGVQVQTLINWHKSRPRAFDLLLKGATAEKYLRK